MELTHRWRDHNLTRLELVVAWLIIVVIIGAFIRSMLVIFTRAERTMVNTTINNINTALKYRTAIAVMRGDTKFLAALAQQNPFTFVQNQQALKLTPGKNRLNDLSAGFSAYYTPPSNYLGELDDPDPATLKAGNWYFDKSDKTLNYLVNNGEYFHGDLGKIPRIKLKVIVNYNDLNGNNHFDPGIDEFKSISLRSIGKYSWTE